jgi:hypothetical protein
MGIARAMVCGREAMADCEKPPAEKSSPWIVCYRRFEVGSANLYAFSTEEQAYLFSALLIRAELKKLLESDEEYGPQLLEALRDGRYDTALDLYHAMKENPDTIDIVQVTVDQFQNAEPMDVAEFARE